MNNNNMTNIEGEEMMATVDDSHERFKLKMKELSSVIKNNINVNTAKIEKQLRVEIEREIVQKITEKTNILEIRKYAESVKRVIEMAHTLEK